jgi:hypothetical protein
MAIKYSSDVSPAPERLERARAVLSEASAKAGVEYRPPRELPMPKAEFQAPVQSVGSVAATLGAPVRSSPGFDRAAHHKAYMKTYMREYMRGWRARRKARPT